MISSAILRHLNTSPRSYLFGLLGSSLLLSSDLIYSMSYLFNLTSRWCNFGIMLTYYCGNYLIMHGSILHCTLQDTI